MVMEELGVSKHGPHPFRVIQTVLKTPSVKAF